MPITHGTARPRPDWSTAWAQSSLRCSASAIGLVLLVTLYGPWAPGAEPLDTWHVVSPVWSTNDLTAVAASPDRFIAVGANGTILTSEDGGTWLPATSGTQQLIQGVAYGNGVFVATGWRGTILTSTNGTVWSPAESSTTANFHCITFANGTFLVAGDAVSAISPDGINWTTTTLSSSNSVFGVSYGNGTYVAAGAPAGLADAGAILTSTNGVNWSQAISGFSSLWGVAFGDGLFVVVGGYGGVRSHILTSPDGQAWDAQESPVSELLEAVAYGNGTFLAVGWKIVSSTNGLTWTQRTSPTPTPLLGVCYGRGIFVAVGWSGIILVAVTPADIGGDSNPLTVTSQDGKIVIGWPLATFPFQGFLERSVSTSGPRTTVTNATHPYEESFRMSDRAFFRARFESY